MNLVEAWRVFPPHGDMNYGAVKSPEIHRITKRVNAFVQQWKSTNYGAARAVDENFELSPEFLKLCYTGWGARA